MAVLFFNLAVLILSLHTRKPLFCNTILSNWYVTTLTSLQWYETASWMVFHSILVKILIYGELHIILLLLMFDSLSVIFFMLFLNRCMVMGQFDTEDNLTPRTIWHRPCKEDNLTPRTIWHRGQFDTIMQNRTIWHRPCREDNLTPRTIWHRGQFDTIINFIFLQLFGPQIWLEIYWLPLSIFLTENYPV